VQVHPHQCGYLPPL